MMGAKGCQPRMLQLLVGGLEHGVAKAAAEAEAAAVQAVDVPVLLVFVVNVVHEIVEVAEVVQVVVVEDVVELVVLVVYEVVDDTQQLKLSLGIVSCIRIAILDCVLVASLSLIAVCRITGIPDSRVHGTVLTYRTPSNVLKNWQVCGICMGEGWAKSYAEVASQPASHREASNSVPVKILFPIYVSYVPAQICGALIALLPKDWGGFQPGKI